MPTSSEIVTVYLPRSQPAPDGTASPSVINLNLTQIPAISSSTNTTVTTKLLAVGVPVLVTCAAVMILVGLLVLKKGATNVNSATTSTTTATSLTAYWSFDGSSTDLFGLYNAVSVNSPTYVTGYVRQAIRLNGANQYLNAPHIAFARVSFTIEVWIYWTSVSNNDNAIIGECVCTTSGTCNSQCLYFIFRNQKILMGFFSNDLTGSTTLSGNTWYHIAFVYDYTAGQQRIYLNGIQDGLFTTTPYIGTSGNITIGTDAINTGSNYFAGYLDQLSITSGAKTAVDILNDATLCAYFSFDAGSLLDYGPNGLNGTVNSAFSFAYWANPAAVSGTLIHVSSGPDGLQNSVLVWCVPFMGFKSTGEIIGQVWPVVYALGPILTLGVWTHIAETFSTANGVRLYINGTLYSTSGGGTSYAASGQPNYITVASYSSNGLGCAQGQVSPGPFHGYIDELKIYSRELNSTDVYALAHP
ncbi:unnamed protein product [Didymodactylos carnosus]|uniref:LamG-like jellyroll fold domain-containing protein n=1 Tax=Didymodactylos carnosus TaxID=1234261 RepID=A0A8S2FDM1_9BILA|nr:unnamed protein product [Didymodactylos carnosus]CAF4231004.1 unnamed protein product [Didymodactylos carnosus]